VQKRNSKQRRRLSDAVGVLLAPGRLTDTLAMAYLRLYSRRYWRGNISSTCGVRPDGPCLTAGAHRVDLHGTDDGANIE